MAPSCIEHKNFISLNGAEISQQSALFLLLGPGFDSQTGVMCGFDCC